MKKRIHFIIMLSLFFCAGQRASAQYYLPENSIWAFGNKSGMNFTSGNPVPIVTSAHNGEGCTSICTSEGQLLFYTNGNKIWDAAGNLFPHGQNLDIPETQALTTTQSAVIVPVPGQLNKYYLFTLGIKLFVYRIDMTLNGGLGDVDTTFALTHVQLKDSLSEKMIAIPGCNNNVWILTRSNFTNQFFAFNVTTQGVATTPTVSAAGLASPYSYQTRTISVSPDGNKIAVSSSDRLELLNFDKTNGAVSMAKILDNQVHYATCFSPNGKLLYGNLGNIYQYNLEDCDPVASRVQLGNGMFGDIRMAPNGKIYFRSIVSITSGTNYLGCIEHPDIVGAGCQFRDSITQTVMPILDPTSALSNSLGLHNTVVRATPDIKFLNRNYFDSCICVFPFDSGLDLVAAPGLQNYLWSDSSTASSLNVKRRGKYWVSYQTTCGRRADTFNIRGDIVPVQLAYNAPVITTSGSYQSYKWFFGGNVLVGSTASTLQPQYSGTYSVLVTNAQGCTDSAAIFVNLGTGINTPDAIANISIYPNPATDQLFIESAVPYQAIITDLTGRELQRFENKKPVSIGTLNNGVYLLKLIDKRGAVFSVKKITKSGR